MSFYQHLLVAIDASERAPYVLRVADAFARRLDVDALALRTVHLPQDLPLETLNLRPDEVELALKAGAEVELQALVKKLGPKWSARVDVATPWDGICRAAQEREGTITVVGSHGYHLLDRFLGTTASRVVNHIASHVLIARPTPAIDHGVERVLVGLDRSSRAESVLATAIELAKSFGASGAAQLVAVRVVRGTEDPKGPRDPQGMMDTAKSELTATLRSVPRELNAVTDVRFGQPWKGLLEASVQCKADIIVIGSHGYDAVDRVLGTDASRVADRAACSVLVVK